MKTILIIALNLLGANIFSQQDELPVDFPGMEWLVVDEPSETGYLFLTPWESWGPPVNFSPYLIIMDNRGTPVFYQKQDFPVYDFKVLADGNLTFWGGSYGNKYFFLDKKFRIYREIEGSFGTDFHDLQLLPNGNVLIITGDYRIVDMDTVVKGGHQGVSVKGNVVEEIGSIGQVIRDYSTWDLYGITDADDYFVDFWAADFIDYAHLNAIEADTDSTLLLSPRNLNEITKIHRETGEIIWRLNGKHNDFEFIGDTIRFSAQHDVRKLENGNIQVFDNGVNNDPQFSSVVEYELDEINMTATLVRRLRSRPNDIFGLIMGSAQRLPDGKTLVGWGNGRPCVTEFNPDGTKSLELDFDGQHYRVFRFPWKTTAFELSKEIVIFEEVKVGDEVSQGVMITNLSDEPVEINRVVILEDAFSVKANTLPVNINPGDWSTIFFQFNPPDTGKYEDVVTICYDIDSPELTQRIARQLTLKGSAFDDTGIPGGILTGITCSSNPGDGHVLLVSNNEPLQELKVSNPSGNIIYEIEWISANSVNFDISEFPPGLYFIQVRSQNGKETTIKYILIE